MAVRERSLRDGWGHIAKWAVDHVELLLLALVVFAMPLFYWPGVTEYNYARTIFMLIVVPVLAAIRLGRMGFGTRRSGAAALRGEHEVRIPWIALPLAGLLLASLISLLHAASARVVIQSIAVLVSFALFGLLVADAVRKPRDAIVLLSALFASACLVSVQALLQYAAVVPGVGLSGASNMIGSMGNPDAVAGFLACALLPSILLVDRARGLAARLALILGIAACGTAILLTRQTGVAVGITAALVLIAIGWAVFPPRPVERRRAAVPVAVLAGLALALALAAALQISRAPSAAGSVVTRLWEENSGSARSTFWKVGWEMFRGNPITGIGLGNYKLAYPRYESMVLGSWEPGTQPPYVANAAQAHNDVLQAAAELGALGILAVVGFLAVLAAALWRRLRADTSWGRFDVLLLCGGLAVFSVHALVGFPAHLAAPALVAVLLAGLAFSPAYGEAAVFSLRLGRRTLRALFAVALLAAVGVSIVAGRDLAANVLQLRGTRQLQVGDDAAALRTLERSIALDFSPRQSNFYLASAQYRLGRYEDALASLTECLRLFPDDNVFLLYADLAAGLGQLDRGLEALDSLLATNPDHETTRKARYVRALILREKGDVSAAIAALRDLIAWDSAYEPSHIALGEIAAEAGRTDEARGHFERALALVEAALPQARAAAAATGRTYAQYAHARERLEELTQERERIRRNLDAL